MAPALKKVTAGKCLDRMINMMMTMTMMISYLMPRLRAYFLLFTFTNSMLYLSVMSSTASSLLMAPSQVLRIKM